MTPHRVRICSNVPARVRALSHGTFHPVVLACCAVCGSEPAPMRIGLVWAARALADLGRREAIAFYEGHLLASAFTAWAEYVKQTRKHKQDLSAVLE